MSYNNMEQNKSSKAEYLEWEKAEIKQPTVEFIHQLYFPSSSPRSWFGAIKANFPFLFFIYDHEMALDADDLQFSFVF